jgi:hypothetical protein
MFVAIMIIIVIKYKDVPVFRNVCGSGGIASRNLNVQFIIHYHSTLYNMDIIK